MADVSADCPALKPNDAETLTTPLRTLSVGERRETVSPCKDVTHNRMIQQIDVTRDINVESTQKCKDMNGQWMK